MKFELPVETRSRKDFMSDQEVRWCPGCGDYSILAQVQKVLPTLDVPRENIVCISGIGCSSRFPYYLDTYGMHSIHGRAPAIATGLAVANPELSVWVVTGDGDALSIGGNHLLHALRRNVNLTILLFNNQIYGLTKGQYSPTSPMGKQTKSTPYGSLDAPLHPLILALSAGATFVARTLDVDTKHMQSVLSQAAVHEGTALIEILQNCNVFNDGVWGGLAQTQTRPEKALYLEEGQPLVYGSESKKYITASGFDLTAGAIESEAVIHSAEEEPLGYPMALASLHLKEGMPMPLGVLHRRQAPCYETQLKDQVAAARKEGSWEVQDLLTQGYTWWVGDTLEAESELDFWSQPLEQRLIRLLENIFSYETLSKVFVDHNTEDVESGWLGALVAADESYQGALSERSLLKLILNDEEERALSAFVDEDVPVVFAADSHRSIFEALLKANKSRAIVLTQDSRVVGVIDAETLCKASKGDI